MSADRKKRKVAVMLSGGGAKGAYEVGALKALRKHKVEPEIYCGTSVGSFNCAMAVSGRMLEEMEDVWVSLTHSRVFKLRFDFKQLLTFDPRPPLRFALESAKILGGILNDSIRTGMSWWQLIDLDSILVDTSPLADLIRKNVVLDALQRNDKEICIALTRLKPVDSDPLVFVRKKQISHDHIPASCSLPLIFP